MKRFCNPKPRTYPLGLQATIMTDPETADQTYIGPMTPELVEEIIAKVLPPLPSRFALDSRALCQGSGQQTQAVTFKIAAGLRFKHPSERGGSPR